MYLTTLILYSVRTPNQHRRPRTVVCNYTSVLTRHPLLSVSFSTSFGQNGRAEVILLQLKELILLRRAQKVRENTAYTVQHCNTLTPSRTNSYLLPPSSAHKFSLFCWMPHARHRPTYNLRCNVLGVALCQDRTFCKSRRRATGRHKVARWWSAPTGLSTVTVTNATIYNKKFVTCSHFHKLNICICNFTVPIHSACSLVVIFCRG